MSGSCVSGPEHTVPPGRAGTLLHMRRERAVVAVVGPTASGKTALSVGLALALPGEIVNADAVQLHRGMDIGSAKASRAERRGVPHHLLDVLTVGDEANVAQFQALARAAIDDVHARDRVPILVGGSSLYVRAALDRLDFPGTDPVVRRRWSDRLEAEGPAVLHELLTQRDPAAAAEILPTNGRRIVRALEVGELTGAPFVATMPEFRSIYPELVMIGLEVPREVLDLRIDQRVDQMWTDGLVDEVRSLPGLRESPTASRALGYQQVLASLGGDLTDEQARQETKSGTRRFARRQDRMMRKDPRIHWLPFDAPDLLDRAVATVQSIGPPPADAP